MTCCGTLHDDIVNKGEKTITLRRFAITCQVLVYTANSAIWILSILAFTCGLVIGLGNNTIRVDIMFMDLAITTPATTFIYYGLPLTVVATVGCFSSISATLLLTTLYILLLIAYMCVDAFLGYSYLFQNDSMLQYYNNVNESMNGYASESDNVTYVGIFPIPATAFWEHLQIRGKCCGIKSYMDWKETNFSKTSADIPDSCCNDDYNYRSCGSELFRHPDSAEHGVFSMVHAKGCADIFPASLGLPPDPRVTYVGRFVLSLLVFCMALSVVLLCLIFTKKFKSEQGLDNPDYVPTPKPSLSAVDNDGLRGDGERGPTPSPGWQFRNVKVHPAQNDDRRNSDPNKRVLFRESGPQFIHDEHHWPHQDTPQQPQRYNQGDNRHQQQQHPVQIHTNPQERRVRVSLNNDQQRQRKLSEGGGGRRISNQEDPTRPPQDPTANIHVQGRLPHMGENVFK